MVHPLHFFVYSVLTACQSSLAGCLYIHYSQSTFQGAPSGIMVHALAAGWLVRTHPHQMAVLMAQRAMKVRLCLGHLRSPRLSNPGYLSLLLLQMGLMQSILLLEHTPATVQSITIRMLLAIRHPTCIRQHCSSRLQLRMTGACWHKSFLQLSSLSSN